MHMNDAGAGFMRTKMGPDFNTARLVLTLLLHQVQQVFKNSGHLIRRQDAKSTHMRGLPYYTWLVLWVIGLPMTGRSQYVLINQVLNGGVTADGYNLRYQSGVQTGTYRLSIPPGTTRIEKSILSLLFTGDYIHSLPQSFQLNAEVYTFSQTDIKTTLYPTPYGTDGKHGRPWPGQA